MNAPTKPLVKHAAVPHLDLRTLKRLLAHREKERLRYLAPLFMEELSLSIQEADDLLRQVAKAGYITWEDSNSLEEEWVLTAKGARLIADPLQGRISRERAEAVLEKALQRIREINADPDRLYYVKEVRLFGSLLNPEATEVGDVDIEIEVVRKPLSDAEFTRIAQIIAPKVPRSWRRSYMTEYFEERQWDRRDVEKTIARGLKELSLAKDVIEIMGCAYKTILRYNIDRGAEEILTGEIIPRTTPDPDCDTNNQEASVPDVTIIQPIGLLKPDERYPTKNLRLTAHQMFFDEAHAWMGEAHAWTRGKENDQRSAFDANKTPSLKFAGAVHLFPDWKDKTLSGLDLFTRALDWAASYNLPIAKAPRQIKLRTYSKQRRANFDAIQASRAADRVEADLVFAKDFHSWKGRKYRASCDYVTPRMVAAHYAIAIALGRMLDEIKLTGQINSEILINLDGLKKNQWPALCDLSRMSRIIRNKLPKVELPAEVLTDARKRLQEYERTLDVHRELTVEFSPRRKKSREILGSICTQFSLYPPDQEPEHIFDQDDLPGEEDLMDAICEEEQRLSALMSQIPGLQYVQISHEAPYVIEHEVA